jgi:hypothetical protein
VEPAASSRGLCIEKNGCDSVASRAAFGRSRVSATTSGPHALGPAREEPAGAQVLEVRDHRVRVERAAVVEADVIAQVNVQRRASVVAQVVASAASGRVPSLRKRTSGSQTFETMAADTRSVARCGSSDTGSASVPTTRVSAVSRLARSSGYMGGAILAVRATAGQTAAAIIRPPWRTRPSAAAGSSCPSDTLSGSPGAHPTCAAT